MASAVNIDVVRQTYGTWLVEGATLDELRRGHDEMVGALPDGVRTEAGSLGDVPGLWLRPENAGAGMILFFHGGGYLIGSSKSHSELAAKIAVAAGMTAFSADYRLAPEHPFPAAAQDALRCYRALLEQGIAPSDLALCGDSAGGGLVLTVLVGAREAGLAQPACAALMSPFTDLTLSGDSVRDKADLDCLISVEGCRGMAQTYLAGADGRDPLASPLYADLAGLPPLLVQVGSDEILLDDSRRLAERGREAGVEVELRQFDGQLHVFQLLSAVVPEATAAIRELGQFVAAHVDHGCGSGAR